MPRNSTMSPSMFSRFASSVSRQFAEVATAKATLAAGYAEGDPLIREALARGRVIFERR